MKFLLVLTMLMSSAFAGEINVKVNGMVCSMCAQGIQKKFSSQPAVEKLDVDMDNKVVHIKTHDNQTLDDAVITKLITEAGYNVAGIERK